MPHARPDTCFDAATHSLAAAGDVAFVALGSNLGDREATLLAVVEAIAGDPQLVLCGVSPIFESRAVGPGEQGPYLNAVIRMKTRRAPDALLEWLQALEQRLGRDRGARSQRWGPRTIDLDLLFYADRVIESADLVVPHPRAHERDFVLAPMAALDPEFAHPKLRATMASLWSAMAADAEDDGRLRLWPAPKGWPPAA